MRSRLDIPLAEAYVAVGRTDVARRISAWLRELGERLNRPALTGDAHRIEALICAAAGDLEAAATRPAPRSPRMGHRRCVRSWPAARWCWA